MGVKELWSILTPFCERKPLYELQGKIVAIDLSGWVCQAQCIAEYQVQPRMYLRNLYFRTCYMLLQEITPVFVLEGSAPTMKYNTIAARNLIQFKGAKPRTEASNAPAKAGKDRSRFNHTLKLCEEMLKLMGLACVTGIGEAEAMCAYLNEEGIVHGCISQDSDCFAYGAKIVYRNFSISHQGAHAASGGSVDVYDLTKATDAIDFGRNKIVVLALLCGSDYNNGVSGIGKDAVTKLFATISDKDILEHVESWRANKSLYSDFENKLADKNICTSCGHSGKLASHTKIGCLDCGTHKGCDFSKFKDKRLEIKNELNIRRKALEDPDFPSREIMDEFMVRKDNVSKLDLKWKRPDVIKFVKFTKKYLEWEELYSFEKVLPILTRWQVYQKDTTKNVLPPEYIKKKRAPKGVASYEIIWTDGPKNFENLIPSDQLKDANLIKLYSTIEPQNLVEKIYPDLVHKYLESKIKPKAKTKRKIKKASTGESPLKKMIRKGKRIEEKLIDDLENSFGIMDINKKEANTKSPCFKTALFNSTNRFDPNMSCFGDENDDFDADISCIIHDIVRQALPEPVQRKLNEFANLKIKNSPKENNMNESSFFMSKANEIDMFEASFQQVDSSDDSSEDYEFDEKSVERNRNISFVEDIDENVQKNDLLPNHKNENKFSDVEDPILEESVDSYENKKDQDKLIGAEEILGDKKQATIKDTTKHLPVNDSSDSDESFISTYVPLYERLKRRK